MKSARAKVLHPLLGRPLGYFALRRAVEFGARPAVAVVGHQAEAVRRALGDCFSKGEITFAVQPEQLGTAHAVLSARPALRGFRGDIAILYGDVPCVQSSTLAALARAKRAARSSVALVATRPTCPKGYGRLVRDDSGRLSRIVEEKDCTDGERSIGEVNAGIYLVEGAFLWKALSRVGRTNAQREFYLTDLVELAARAGWPAATVEAPFEEVAGVNDRSELARAAEQVRRGINEALMRQGVSFDDPRTTFVDESVRIGRDARIGPFCTLSGASRIGRAVTVGAGCIIHDSTVLDGAQLRPYCILEEAQVGPGALVGPFARLRPGTELGPQVHVGNFVETKKARIGKGSKANHLTYLGDCSIGSGVNVGAGTITCNYDGVHKHPTVLGDGVFVGSDSQFVAPIVVGKGAYIGAGSTIVEDVPPYSLAIARSRQVTKKGYLKRQKR
jgi:bifunctional UDP-N-acetylglucosamine pyrophosphorylase/glucosamine-1-phosphate N-acetyltransferase